MKVVILSSKDVVVYSLQWFAGNLHRSQAAAEFVTTKKVLGTDSLS